MVFNMKDFVSLFAGLFLFLAGLLPLLSKLKIGPEWFSLPSNGIAIFSYVVAIGGAYLFVNSLIEVANSNAIGWTSFGVAVVFFIIGLLQVLSKLGIGPGWFGMPWIGETAYYIIFMIEGIFLMIAMWAMEL